MVCPKNRKREKTSCQGLWRDQGAMGALAWTPDTPEPVLCPRCCAKGSPCGMLFGLSRARSWSSNALATWCEELIHWKRPGCWERLKAGGEGDRGWDGWMASPTRWTWVWVSSGSWWWTRKPGVLQSMGSQRVGHDWVIDWTERWRNLLVSIAK